MTPLDGVERAIRGLLRDGDAVGAVRVVLEAQGPEVFGFLCGVLADLSSAESVYADVVQRITTEVQDFQWRCSLRTWTYWIARRELADRRRRRAPVPPRSPEPLDPVATETNQPKGTFVLRERLNEEDRELLILRVDRGFRWPDLALSGLGEGASKAALDREVLRLRACVDRITEDIRLGATEERPR